MTDEVNCSFLKVPRSYSKVLPPVGKDGKPAQLDLSIKVEKIASIDTFNSRFSIMFTMGLWWHDYRLVFENINKKRGINVLSLDELRSIWVPKLAFKNALAAKQTVLDMIHKQQASHRSEN